MTTRYYNEQNDVLVLIKDNEEFVILGDESLVTDDEIFALYDGAAPAGWVRSEEPR